MKLEKDQVLKSLRDMSEQCRKSYEHVASKPDATKRQLGYYEGRWDGIKAAISQIKELYGETNDHP